MTVSITHGALARPGPDRSTDLPRVDQAAAQVVRRIFGRRFALVLSTNGSQDRLYLRTAGISSLFKAHVDAHPGDGAEFFRALVATAECPVERIIHVDSDPDRVMMALERGIRAVLLAPYLDPHRPLPHGGAHVRDLTDLPEVLIQLLRTPISARGLTDD